MPEPIHNILAEVLGLETENAASLLSEYVESLLDELESSESIEIEDLGRFRLTEEGISFDVHPSLQSAVNFRYGRLQVLEASFPLPEGETVEIEEEPEVVKIPVRDVEIPLEAISTEAPESEPADETEIDIVEILDDVQTAEPEPVEVPTSDHEEPEAEQIETDRSDRPTRSDRPARRTPRTKDRSLSRMLGLLIPVLVVISVVVYAMIGTDDTEPSTPSLAQQEEGPAAAESTPADIGQDDSQTRRAPGDTDIQNAPSEDLSSRGDELLSSIPQEPEDETLRLTRSSEGFTLMVGSTFSMEAAERELTRYTEMGFITGVLTYDDEGVSRLRMAVGQFDTVEEADSMRQALAGQLPEGTWVWRIR